MGKLAPVSRVKPTRESCNVLPTTSVADLGLSARVLMLAAEGAGRQALSVHASPEAQSAWPRQPPGTHRLATHVRPEGQAVLSEHAVVGWQCESRQYAVAEHSESTRQRGSS